MGKDRAEKIREFILTSVAQHPSDLVEVVERKFGVTRTTVHRHINTLINNEKLIKTGAKKGARYYLAGALNKELVFKIVEHPEEHKVWDDSLSSTFKGIDKGVEDICYYGFGEIFNNAVDHSEGKKIKVDVGVDAEKIELTITDDGIGVFRKIQEYLNLEDIRESVLHLIKGKFTTAPDYHSGEGIFFSSRAFDVFTIYSNGLLYVRDNSQDDWFIEDRENSKGKGTIVTMEIMKNSKRDLQDIFDHYQNPETKAFDKTHILVQFSKLGDERFVSRSQAKRILKGIEKFNHVILDFKGISAVGQAFVDEVFRVFKGSHPEIKIEHINANDAIEFMIKRGLSTAELNRG